MKRLISVLCIAVMLIGLFAAAALSASAAEPAQTMVDVKKGDKVSYVLQLADVPEVIVCYEVVLKYDASVLQIDSVADFTNSTNEEDWGGNGSPVINYTGIPGEVRANWYTGSTKGVDFSKKKNFFTMNFTAIADGTPHISYHITNMAGNSYFENDNRPVITEYTFTCKVSVNGSAVLQDAEPELASVDAGDIGTFTNSVTGKSVDASEPAAAGSSSSGGNNGGSGNSGNNSGSGNSGSNGNGGSGNNGSAATPTNSNGGSDSTAAPDDGQAQPATGSGASPASGNEAEPPADDAAGSSSDSSGGSLTWLWIVIGAVAVLGGGGLITFLLTNKKK